MTYRWGTHDRKLTSYLSKCLGIYAPEVAVGVGVLLGEEHATDDLGAQELVC